MRILLSLFLTSVIVVSCQDGSSSARSGSGDEIPTGALVISGSLANGEDSANTAFLEGQKVSVVRSDGMTVGEGTSDASGDYAISFTPGALVVGSGFSLVDTPAETPAATSDDFTYTLEVKVPDDGTGKALGLRRKIDLVAGNVADGTLALGESKLKQINAITGKVAFAESNIKVSGVDVFIPGLPFFVRTGDDGVFNLFFVPSGTYSIRLTKGTYLKDYPVTVTAGKTLSVGTVTIAANERDPLPLADVLIGTWDVTCYYQNASGVTPEAPVTGTVTVSTLTSVALNEGGKSCVMRSVGVVAAPEVFKGFSVMGDGAIIAKHESGSASYYFHNVLSYSNNQITFAADKSGFVSSVIEVWKRK